VLLLDVDTRALNGEGGMMNEHLDYHALSPHTAGMLSHYLYGMSSLPRALFRPY
jgi:hypothetical protein